MSTTVTHGVRSSTRLLEPTAALVAAGLVVLLLGRVIFEAALAAWLGATRSRTAYLGPALLLGSNSPSGAMLLGAAVWALGFSAFLLGTHRLAHHIDLAARGPRSAIFVTAGLISLAIGSVIYRVAESVTGMAPVPRDHFGVDALLGTGVSAGHAATVVGAILAVVGLAALAFGLYRLVVAIRLTTMFAADPPTPPVVAAQAP
jgi:hypothetical protein